MENLQEKDLVPIKTELADVQSEAYDLEIKQVKDMVIATEMLSRIKLISKNIKETKEGATKPISEGLKMIRGWFAPLEDGWKNADGVVRKKMSSFQMEEDRKAQIERDRIAREMKEEQDRIANDKRLKDETKEEKEEVVVEKAMENIEKVDEGHQTKFKAESGSVHFRTDKVVEIEPFNHEFYQVKDDFKDNHNLIPAEYLMLDVKKIEKVARAGVEIPGVSVREVKTVVNR